MTRRKKRPVTGAKPRVSPELEGFEIGINPFGEIQINTPIEKINKFLNEHLADRKLKNRIKK